MFNFLKNIYYRKYRISFMVTRPFAFNGYPYHLLRGVFGMVVRNEVCVKAKDEKCSRCNQNQNCPFTEIFDVKLPDSHPLLKEGGKYRYPPVPYILYPDFGGKTRFNAGEIFTIELTLIGSAIEYDTFLLQCIQRISEGKGLLYRKLECAGIETMVGDNRKSHLRFNVQSETANHLKLHFNSPVILKSNEKPVNSITFELLAGSLTERLHLLSSVYCGAEMPDVKLFRKHITTDSYIDSFYPVEVKISDGGNKQTPPKEGLLGSVAYQGNLGEYMPLIRAGEILHLGGYSNYGLGKFTIDKAYFV